LKDAREIIRRHLRDESIRVIARALGLPRTSVHRVVQEYRAAQQRQRPGWAADGERDDAEFDALVSRYEGSLHADAEPDPVLVAELREGGVDVECEETLDLLRAYTQDPNPLNEFRLQNAPKTAQWWSVRNKLGQLLTEEEEIKAKLTAGWRYRDGAWRTPEEALSWRGRADW
jgi:hypothetical protein